MLLKRLFREHPLGTVGAAILLVLILVSIFADALAPFRFGEMNLDDRLAAPSSLHPLGTDQLGRDFLSRLIHGARLSLFVGLAATTLHVVVAALIGGTAGFLGGRFDLVMQRFVDAWMSMPGLLVLLTIMSLAGRGLLQIILVLGISSGISNSRVVRGAVIAIKENDYFQAARAVGSPASQILWRHVLPNVMPPTRTSIRGSAMSEPLPVDAGGGRVNDRRRPVADFFGRLLRQQPLGAAAGVVLLVLAFIAVFAERLTPHEYDVGRVQERLQAPSAEHPLGTDHAGRDVLARILKGA